MQTCLDNCAKVCIPFTNYSKYFCHIGICGVQDDLVTGVVHDLNLKFEEIGVEEKCEDIDSISKLVANDY